MAIVMTTHAGIYKAFILCVTPVIFCSRRNSNSPDLVSWYASKWVNSS